MAVGLVPRIQEVRLDATVLTAALVLAALAALVSGTVPALALARRDVADRLRGRGATADSRRQRRIWSSFLAAQVTLTLLLVVAPLFLLASATLAAWLPARRAARVDPLDALRLEG